MKQYEDLHGVTGVWADEPPTCRDATGGADDLELMEAWGVAVDEEPDEEGHLWARPHQLVGGLPENPGVVGVGAGVIESAVCLRCGTMRTINTAATDPESGVRIMRVLYAAGLFAEEVAEAAARYRVGEVAE